jgi:hypothetical protein
MQKGAKKPGIITQHLPITICMYIDSGIKKAHNKGRHSLKPIFIFVCAVPLT